MTPRFDELSAVFAALGHEVRLRVVHALLRAAPDGLITGELQDRVRIPASTLSHHLDALRKAGVVETTREGVRLRQRVAMPALMAAFVFLEEECCADERVVQLPGTPRR